MEFRNANFNELSTIYGIYTSVKNSAFCVWNDAYPGMQELKHDFETENLYVMADGSNIAGVISIVPENEMNNFDCWSTNDGTERELARVAVAKEYQGNGIASNMVCRASEILKTRGCNVIRMSVAKINIPAYKTYFKSGFKTVGEAEMYENSYFLIEKML